LRWKKLGRVLEAPSHLPWARTHAALPIATPLDGGRAQVYFSSRDEMGRAQIGRATLDLDAPGAAPDFEPEPLVRLGRSNRFDESGVTVGCLVADKDRLYLYYSGWSLPPDVPFLFYIGCAVSTDGGKSFEKVSDEPVLGRSRLDPYVTASPSILIEGGLWRMWYVSGTGWDGNEPNYNIKYAESTDGIDWHPTGNTCIDYSYPGEHAIARPHVMKDGAVYRMWFCHRGDAYRIGYAESRNGISWTRMDGEAGITVSAEGWDSEMVAYPWVGDIGGRRRMLYNGNSYGRTGIGEAILEAG